MRAAARCWELHGSEWLLRLHHMSSPHGSAEFHSMSKPLSQAKPEWQKRVQESLYEDAAHNLNATFPGDSYGFGKAASNSRGRSTAEPLELRRRAPDRETQSRKYCVYVRH